MTVQDLSTDARKLLQELWEEFRKRGGQWPPRKPFVVRLDSEGKNLDEITGSSRGAIWVMQGGQETVQASFGALALLPEVRSLLEPLPGLLRAAAKKYTEEYAFDDERPPKEVTLCFDDIRNYWPSEDHALQAVSVMVEAHGCPLHWGRRIANDPKAACFRLDVETLRYERVQTLDEVIELPNREYGTDVGAFPSGKHLAVIRAIFEHARKHGAWPVALPFAVEHRALGHVPQIVMDLSKRFVRGHFGASRHQQLGLQPASLALVDTDGEGRRLIIDAVRAVASLWKSWDEEQPIPLDAVAEALHVQPSVLAPWVLFLEWAPWGSCYVGEKGWRCSPREECLKNLKISSWEEYVETWHPHRSVGALDFLEADGADEPDNGVACGGQAMGFDATSLAFVKSEPLLRVIERDVGELELVLASGAWKSALLVAGSIVEAVLVDALDRRPDIAGSFMRGNKRWPDDAGLAELVEIAAKCGLIQDTVRSLAGMAKDYRDLIHPVKASKTALRPKKETAEAVAHALKIILSDLEEARCDGRLMAYEMKP